MISNQDAIEIIKKLVKQGFLVEEKGGSAQKKGIRLTDNDINNLNKHHSLGKNYKKRNGQIFDAMIAGFMVSASKGEMFVSEENITRELGKPIAQNYPEASATFLKFAKTYWSLRVLVSQLHRGEDGLISFIGGRLLGALEGEIGPLFFPFPGPNKVPPAEREQVQREVLSGFVNFSDDINIDIEDFIRGNPILIRDRQGARSGGGCLGFVIAGFVTITAAILYGILIA